MPDGFEQRQEVAFFLLQPFNLNLAIGLMGGVSVLWGAEQNTTTRNATAQGGAVPMGRAKSEGALMLLPNIPHSRRRRCHQRLWSFERGLSPLAEQLPPLVSD
jgi:hypothetical protein